MRKIVEVSEKSQVMRKIAGLEKPSFYSNSLARLLFVLVLRRHIWRRKLPHNITTTFFVISKTIYFDE